LGLLVQEVDPMNRERYGGKILFHLAFQKKKNAGRIGQG
jgi:hypothetical protein